MTRRMDGAKVRRTCKHYSVGFSIQRDMGSTTKKRLGRAQSATHHQVAFEGLVFVESGIPNGNEMPLF